MRSKPYPVLSKRGLYAIAAAVGIILLSWPHLFFKGQIPIDGNMIRMGYPNWVVARAPLGSIPLWNPYRNMGEPFLADPQTMAGYPLHWLFAPRLSFLNFMRVWVLFHSLLAAFFMGCLAFRWYEDEWAAFTAAAVMALNGFFISRATLPNHFAALAWLPAILFFTETRRPVFLGLCLAFQWLAGFPPFSLLSGLLALVLTAGNRHKFSGWVLGGSLAAALAAFQLLPFLEFFKHSSRPAFLQAATALENSESFSQLVKMCFVPQWYSLSPIVAGDQAIVTVYFGVAIFLAIFAVFRGARLERRLALLAGAGALLSCGNYLPSGMYSGLFHFFRFPANWLLWTTVCVALLTGAGITFLPSTKWKCLALGLVVADLSGFAHYVRVPWLPPPLLEQASSLAKEMQTPTSGRLYHAPGITEFYTRQGWKSLQDFALMKAILIPSLGMAYGVREVESYEVLKLQVASDYQARLAQAGPGSPLARWAGISNVVTLAPGAREIKAQALRVVALQNPEPALFFPHARAGDRILETKRTPGRLSASLVAASGGEDVVFSEIDYPGWQLVLDGTPQAHDLFEKTFLSFHVPAGRHDAIFQFVSISFRAGRWITLACIFGLILYAIIAP